MTLEAGFSHPGEVWASDSCGVRAQDSGSGLTARETAQQVYTDQRQAGSSLVKQESEIKKKDGDPEAVKSKALRRRRSRWRWASVEDGTHLCAVPAGRPWLHTKHPSCAQAPEILTGFRRILHAVAQLGLGTTDGVG